MHLVWHRKLMGKETTKLTFNFSQKLRNFPSDTVFSQVFGPKNSRLAFSPRRALVRSRRDTWVWTKDNLWGWGEWVNSGYLLSLYLRYRYPTNIIHDADIYPIASMYGIFIFTYIWVIYTRIWTNEQTHKKPPSHHLLLGGFSPTHLKNIRKSKWSESPQGSG